MILPGPLLSDRLIVRPFKNDDRAGFVHFMTTAEVTRFLNFTDEQKTKSGAEGMFNWVIRTYSSQDPIVALCIADKETDEFVGSCGLSPLENQNEIECYYSLLPKFWKRGFAQEAMNLLIQHAFQEMAAQTIVAFVHPDNSLAQILAERVGLLRTGVILHPEHGQECVRYALKNPFAKGTNNTIT